MLLAVFFASCNSQEKFPDLIEKKIPDTLERQVAVHASGDTTLVYKATQEMAKWLKLERLDYGYDQLQIRIWSSYAFKDSAQLFLLKKHMSDDWNVQLYNYWFHRKDVLSGDYDTVLFVRKEARPKSGWNSFIRALTKFKISELPDMDSLPGQGFIISEGDVFTVEFATKNRYRLYTYVNPDEFSKKWWQAKNMEAILQLIEKEFNFKRLR
jgi:hypothetical protein